MLKRHGSFTMIELLIVVTAILLFSGVSVGYYTQFSERTKLDNATKRIISMLSLVRQKTISGDSTMCTSASPPGAVSFYAFEINNSSSYTVRPFCAIGTPQPMNYSNESNIEFITPPPPTPPLPKVTFFPVTGGSVCTFIYIKNKTLSTAQQCRYIKVDRSGSLSEGTCSDCASCCNSCTTPCP